MKTLKYLLTALLLSAGSWMLQAQQLALGLYPPPQKITISSQTYVPARGFSLKGISNPDAEAVRILKETLPFVDKGRSLPIEIKKLAASTPEMARSGAYTLAITKKGIKIGIVDDRSLFYAAQTIRQLAGFDETGRRSLPLCSITDYPDVAYRGTVEGFYGQPWNHADRLEQLRFYGRLKMNTYIYGPKDDPYHSSPGWRDPYPADQAAQIRELAAEAARHKVNFVWAVHPGQDIQWNRTDSANLLAKFQGMYDLGVRAFAVFFDDISGEGTNAEKQAGLMNYIQQEFISQKEGVEPLILCPTEYNRAMAQSDYLEILGKQLDPAIQIMWTGDRVVGDITRESVDWATRRIRRPVFVWWNFPVNDYCRDHLLMGPAQGLDQASQKFMSGFVANPMEWAEASKIALFSVGVYAWNMGAYNPDQAWEDACNYIMPGAAIALRTFAENNCDPGPNGHEYRRDESARYRPQAETFLRGYQAGLFHEREANQLGALFSQITAAPTLIYSQGNNKRMIAQINPWLTQFELLGKTGTASLRMAQAWQQKDRAATWQRYLDVAGLLDSMRAVNRTLNQNAYQSGVKTGSRVLMPFIMELYHRTSHNLLADDASDDAIEISRPSLLTNVDALRVLPCIAEENRVACTPRYEAVKIGPEGYISLGWEIQKTAAAFNFNMPESNVPGRVFEWSADGKNWTAFSGIDPERVKGTCTEIDPKARFIRMRNASGREMELFLLNFSVTTQESETVNGALMVYDMNLDTYKRLQPGDGVQVKCAGTEAIVLFLSGSNENLVSVAGIDKEGEKHIVYQGNVGYIRLPRALYDSLDELTVSTIGNQPIRIHQIVREGL